MRRLLPNVYLNDTLVDFLASEYLTSKNSDRIFMFQAQFYQQFISTQHGYTIQNGYTNANFNYDRVESTTTAKKLRLRTDIFTYKFIGVPIALNLHWSLAIIANSSTYLVSELQHKYHIQNMINLYIYLHL